MDKFKISKKLFIAVLFGIATPYAVIQMAKAQVPSDVLMIVAGGMLALGGVHNVMQGLVDRKKQ